MFSSQLDQSQRSVTLPLQWDLGCNLSKIQFCLADRKVFFWYRNHCLSQPGWEMFSLFQSTDLNQVMKVNLSFHTLDNQPKPTGFKSFSLAHLWATYRDMEICTIALLERTLPFCKDFIDRSCCHLCINLEWRVQTPLQPWPVVTLVAAAKKTSFMRALPLSDISFVLPLSSFPLVFWLLTGWLTGHRPEVLW